MAQAAPLAGLHCPMVAVPRPPRAAARKLRLLSARTAGLGRPLNRRASVRARASTCSFDLRIGRNGRRLLPLRCAPNVSVRVAFVRNN